jgi:large subunit ribosomal protein L5e
LKTDIKTKKSYFKRYQTKFRRRREGKTNYRRRRNLIRQDCNKYGALKSRFVVRITNSKVICQIVKAHVEGDRNVAYADSTELKRYGITFGLTNYSAAYATGLLCSRRALRFLHLDETYTSESGKEGQYRVVEDSDLSAHRAYQCFLDIGLARSSKGAKVFAAMKGGSDGGIRIPHSPAKFFGYDSANPDSFDEKALRDRIFGKNISEYMISLRDNEPEKYKKQFSDYIRKGVEPEDIEKVYEAAFDKIRLDCEKKEKENKFDYSVFRQYKKTKLPVEERKRRVAEKLTEVRVEE